MRLSIRHRLSYTFPEPTRNVTRILRLTPRSFEGQHVVDWQIDIDTDCVLRAGEDGFGNVTHSFTARGPCERLSILVFGEIDNFDAAGVVRGSAERLPVELYMRETPLTLAGDALRAFAAEVTRNDAGSLGKLHALLEAIHATIAFEPERTPTDAATAFTQKSGNGPDLAHVFAACARHLGFPARVVNGYYLCDERKRGLSHAWSEVFIDGLGWTAFDAAHEVCPQEAHVRLATGLDFLAAAPVRGVGSETVEEELVMRALFDSGQSQGPGWQRQSQGGQSQSQG